MDWPREAARAIVAASGDRESTWGARPGGAPRVEPTALAALALLCGGDPAARAVARQAADWMAGLARSDGGLPLSMGLEESSWPTSFAILLWNVLDVHEEPRRKACGWLLDSRDDDPGAIDHQPAADTAPAGWPWVVGTYTWIEPSALALIALQHEGEGGHPRVIEAVGMLYDRALANGGWNAGNKAVFGRELRPQPTATAVALIALAGRRDPSIVADHAVDYLADTLEHVRSAASLGWGLLALRAWDAYPKQADAWLEQAYKLCLERDASPASLALLVLAASQQGVRYFVPNPVDRPADQPTRGSR